MFRNLMSEIRNLLMLLFIQLKNPNKATLQGVVIFPDYYLEGRLSVRPPIPKSIIQRLFEDFVHVINSLTFNDLLLFFKNLILEDFLNETIWGTIKAMGEALQNAFKFVQNLITRPIKTMNEAFKKFEMVKDYLFSLKDKFLEMDATEKLFLVLKITVALYAGVIGYNIPDMDISIWDIRSHRHFFTHSVGPIMITKILSLAFMRIAKGFKERLPENHHPVWNGLLDGSMDLVKAAEIGIVAGVGIHLFEDLFIDGSQAIRGPWGGTFIKGTYLDDNAYLAVNLFAAGFGFREREG